MKRQIDAALASALSLWVDAVRHRARVVVVAILITTVVAAIYTLLNLGINSDNLSLVSEQLPSRRAHQEFIRQFPNLEEALFIVVDAETPELARSAASLLTEQLQLESDQFSEVYLPGGGDFFERHGLLYRSPEELDDFADQMARVQPLIAELELDPSIAHMAEIVRLGLDDLDAEGRDVAQWSMVLDRLSHATVAIYDEFPLAISWEELLLEGSSLEISTRRAIVAHPILDYSDVLLGRTAIARVHEVARRLGLVPERGVRVRVTGNPALSYEEMIGFAWDIGGAGSFCLVLVTLILQRALRSLRLVAAAFATLVVGLIWTAAFATVAIGELNLLSISFAILYIGLGVDFGIHLGTGYADLLRRGLPHGEALRQAAGHVGTALAFCTLTTAIGFYVFIPTDYRGMAELGAIAGTGMFIIFFLTLTLFPALVSGPLRIDPARHLRAELRFTQGGWSGLRRHPAAVRWLALAAGLASLAVLPRAHFNVNPVDMRDPSTESVQAFRDLLSHSDTSPWYLNVLAPDLQSAAELAERIGELESVARSISLASYVPERQEEKLEILADIAFLFDSPGGAPAEHTEPTDEEQVGALRELHDYLATLAGSSSETALAKSMQRLRDHLGTFLERVGREDSPEEALEELDDLLLASLPQQLARLRRALEAEEIQMADLPDRLRKRMLASDGTARVQVFPAGDLSDLRDFESFVLEVKAFAPDASGVPVNLLEFGTAISASFRQALIYAVVLISLLLWLLWRSVGDVALVMAPLFLGASLTGATIVALGLGFNFTNVVVIPLLFGIGVDSAIHLVQRANEGLNEGEGLLDTASARAVYYSALTTVVSFGSLSFAGHRGIKGLGIMLTAGLIYTVVSVLLVLPALIDLRRPGRRGTP